MNTEKAENWLKENEKESIKLVSKFDLKQIAIVMQKDTNQQLILSGVVSSKNKPKRTLGDFDVWYKPCTRCGYDTAKSTKPKDGNKTCWKCGNFVQRDYTDRALKK